MAESFISKKIGFIKDRDKTYFIKQCLSCGIGAKEVSLRFGVSRRTASDWLRGKYRMPLGAGLYISKNFDVDLRNYIIIDRDDHLREIASKGGRARYSKFGKVALDENKRRCAWKKWWDQTGRFKKLPITQAKPIIQPQNNKSLAEFMGIMAGDGGIAPYHITVTLNSEDKEYIMHVGSLVEKLFGSEPRVYKKKHSKAVDVRLARKEASLFCQRKGLPLGDKIRGRLKIPTFIKQKEIFQRNFIKGLFDTDGSVFIHTYKSKDKMYQRPIISITNAYRPFLKEVSGILKNFGFSVRITKNQRELRLESKADILRFFSEIGSENEKRLRRFENWRSAGAV